MGRWTEGGESCRIKAGVAGSTSGRSQLPAVRAVARVLRCIKSGIKIRPVLSPLRSRTRNTYCHNKKTEVKPQKGAVYGQKREIRLLPLSGEEGHLRAAVPGGLKPQSHRLHRTSRRLLSGLLQRQQRRTLSPGLHQILCGRPTGTVGESDVLSAVQAGSGAGYGSRHSGGCLSIQRR